VKIMIDENLNSFFILIFLIVYTIYKDTIGEIVQG
jgi:hypothetical protein